VTFCRNLNQNWLEKRKKSVGGPWFPPPGHRVGTSLDDPSRAVLIGQLSSIFVEPLGIRNIDTLLEPKSSKPFHSAQTV
jgi:hypothetical protein